MEHLRSFFGKKKEKTNPYIGDPKDLLNPVEVYTLVDTGRTPRKVRSVLGFYSSEEEHTKCYYIPPEASINTEGCRLRIDIYDRGLTLVYPDGEEERLVAYWLNGRQEEYLLEMISDYEEMLED